jgi:CRP/FNR family transcriptional regulator
MPEMLLQKGGEQQQLEAGTVLSTKDEKSGFFFITYGVIKVSAHSINQEDVFLHLLNRGDMYGFGFEEHPFGTAKSARAVTRSMVIFLPSQTLDKLSHEGSLLNPYFLGLLLQQQYRHDKQHIYNVRFDIRTRLKLFLKDYALRFGLKNSDPLTIQNYLSHTEIAQLLCSSRQTISTIFNHWKAKKQIAYTRKWIRILDPEFFGKSILHGPPER